MNVPPPGLPSMNVPPPGMGAPPPNVPPSGDYDFSHNDDNYEDYYGGGYEPTQESQWQVPPAYQDHTPPPNRYVNMYQHEKVIDFTNVVRVRKNDFFI